MNGIEFELGNITLKAEGDSFTRYHPIFRMKQDREYYLRKQRVKAIKRRKREQQERIDNRGRR